MRPRICGNPECGNPLPKTRWVFCSERCSNRVHHAKERERKALARAAGQDDAAEAGLEAQCAELCPGHGAAVWAGVQLAGWGQGIKKPRRDPSGLMFSKD